MKRIVMMIALGLTACSNDDDDSKPAASGCDSPAVGTWTGVAPNTDKLIATADGKFSYTGNDGCQTSGTYACPGTVTNGTMAVTISVATASPYCLSAGNYTCAFTVSSNAMTYACGSAAARSYTK
jgi:hypothetical protein